MKNLVGSISAPFRLIRNKFFFLIFLNGFILALIGYFYTENNYEEKIFDALSLQVSQTSSSQTTDSILITSLHVTHELERYRLSVFGNKDISTFKSDLIRPVTFDLITGNGACGSFSYVLARILNQMSIPTRFAQMKVNGEYGGHILVEAFNGHKWVVLDPSYDLAFKTENGNLASFAEVQNNWMHYSAQVPEGYNPIYAYSGVQYTNWDKIPVVMPALKQVLNFTIGEEEANVFSIRNLFLRKFQFLFRLTLGFYILFTLVLIRMYKKQAREIEEFRLSLIFPKKSTTPQAPLNPALG